MSGPAGGQTPNKKMPKDAAQLVLWFKGLPQPTAFLTTLAEAETCLERIGDGADQMEFLSYPDGSGMRSHSIFQVADLRGVTIEYPTLQLASVN